MNKQLKIVLYIILIVQILLISISCLDSMVNNVSFIESYTIGSIGAAILAFVFYLINKLIELL